MSTLVNMNNRSVRTIPRRARNDVRHLSLRRVLPERTEEVPEHFARHGARALLVEQSECLLVFCSVPPSLSYARAMATGRAYLRYRSATRQSSVYSLCWVGKGRTIMFVTVAVVGWVVG